MLGITVDDLMRRLDAARQEQAALAFDADGTLWSGDVGEDGFLRAVAEQSIREEALPAMLEIAARFSVPAAGRPHEVARALWTAYAAGRFPEREVCEVMAWCYAGWSATEFASYCDDVVRRSALASRLHRELTPIIEWSRRVGLQLLVVSASPRGLVDAGAKLWGFGPEEVIAATPAADRGRIAARLISPVPYAETKCELANARIAGRQWLASFGDNVFDIDMLRAARIGIAVRPKPALLERLASLPGIAVLAP